MLETYTVNTNLDVSDSNDSFTSLREAITQANSTAGADTITFTGDIFTDTTPNTITLISGELGISEDLTIQGTGANNLTISRSSEASSFRIFNISAANVTLDGLTIANGNANNGGGILYSNSTSNATLNLTNSTISGNTAFYGGGIDIDSGTVNVTNSTISGNTANYYGGGIFNSGTATVTNSTISGNTASYYGGGIFNSGTATVTNSTISGNTASYYGGGIINSGTATVTNSTISGNEAALEGGGIYNQGTATLTNATITDNDAFNGSGVYQTNNGGIEVKNTIIAGNNSLGQGGSNPDISGGEESEIPGRFTSLGNNLIGISDGEIGFVNGVNGDIVGTSDTPIDPQLAALANNGGSTQTHALLRGSPALNAGNNTAVPATDQPTDQRGFGFDRSVDVVDIGAYEYQTPNQEPVISLPSAALAYTENDVAVIDSLATVSDDSVNFFNGTLTVQFAAESGIAEEDRLAIRDQGTATGEIGVSGSNITYGGTTIGSFTGGTDGSTPLAITFNINATPTAAQALLQNITYENISDNPSTAPREVNFVLTDGDTGTSNTATKTINVIAVNDEPTLEPVSKVGKEDAAITFDANNFIEAFRDVDTDELTQIQITSLPETGTLKLSGINVTEDQQIAVNDLANLTFTPAANFNGNVSFNWNGFDGTSYAATESTVNLTINPVNDAPTISTVLKVGAEDTPISFTTSDFTNSFKDIDGDKLTKIKVTSLPTNGTLQLSGKNVTANQVITVGDLNSGNLSFTPNANFNGNVSFNWNGFDGTSYAAKGATVNLNVLAVNDAPTLNDITKTGSEDTAIAFTASDFTAAFSDVDSNSLTQIQITSLPNNGTLQLSGETVTANQQIAAANLGQLSFTPAPNFNGDISFNWNGFDGTTYATAGASVNLTITPVNDAPTVSNVSRTFAEDTAIAFSKENFTNSFRDVDSNSLTKIQLTSLPENGTLTFNGETVTANQEIDVDDLDELSFTPTTNFNGNISFNWNGFDGTTYATSGATVNLTVIPI